MNVPSTRRTLLYVLTAALLAAVLVTACPATAQTPTTTPGDKQGQTTPSQQAQPGLSEEIKKPVARLTTAIETAEKALQQLSELEDELGRLRVEVEEILAESVETAEELRPQLSAVRSQIEKLGPPPGKDAPPEAPAIAADRARLNALASELDGAIKAAELTWVRARQLIERITVLRHSIFAKNLLERVPTPLLPALWRDFAGELPAIGRRLNYLSDDWWYWAGPKNYQLAGVLALALLAFLVLRIINYRVVAHRRQQREEPPTFFERAISVSWASTPSICCMRPGAEWPAPPSRPHSCSSASPCSSGVFSHPASRNGVLSTCPIARRAASCGCCSALPPPTPSTLL
jgi:potassium efflux system protein